MGVLNERRLACEMVASQLYTGILNGDFPPGRQLPSERALARRMGVSRNTIREGLARLEAKGVVWTRAGLGSWPADPNYFTRGDQLVDWIQLSDDLRMSEVSVYSLLNLPAGRYVITFERG